MSYPYSVDTITVTKTKIRVVVPDLDTARKVIVVSYFREMLTPREVEIISEYLSSDFCDEQFFVKELQAIPEMDYNQLLDIMKIYLEKEVQTC